jgi:hypothetical protein
MAREPRSNRSVQSWAPALERASVLLTMTAKEKLLGDLLVKASPDDEPTTADEQSGLLEARDQAARGDVVSAEEIRREFA